MKRKKIMSVLLAMVTAFIIFTVKPQTIVNAENYSNIGKNNYWKFGYWAHTVTSYQIGRASCRERVSA